VRADAWHHLSDAITSAFAFVGITVALFTKDAAADNLAALCASPIILFNGLRQIKALYANYSTPLHQKQWPSMCGESRDKWQMLPAWTTARSARLAFDITWISLSWWMAGSLSPLATRSHIKSRFDLSRRSADCRGSRAY